MATRSRTLKLPNDTAKRDPRRKGVLRAVLLSSLLGLASTGHQAVPPYERCAAVVAYGDGCLLPKKRAPVAPRMRHPRRPGATRSMPGDLPRTTGERGRASRTPTSHRCRPPGPPLVITHARSPGGILSEEMAEPSSGHRSGEFKRVVLAQSSLAGILHKNAWCVSLESAEAP